MNDKPTRIYCVCPKCKEQHTINKMTMSFCSRCDGLFPNSEFKVDKIGKPLRLCYMCRQIAADKKRLYFKRYYNEVLKHKRKRGKTISVDK